MAESHSVQWRSWAVRIGMVVINFACLVLAEEVKVSSASAFITADTSQFGHLIEGTAVDRFGKIFAVHYGVATQQLGQVTGVNGESDQQLFFKWGSKDSYFNGIRFFPEPYSKNSEGLAEIAVVADKAGQILQLVENREDGILTGRVFCKDERMLEPNDVAIAYTSRRVYSSGLNYAPTTSLGDGDIWMCELSGPRNFSDFNAQTGPVAKATRLIVQGRANGVEVSPDEKFLYASETWAKDMQTFSNKVWKYEIDPSSGHLSNKELFFDMKPFDNEAVSTEGFDIDGMRVDSNGNLFLVRNGAGEVIKVSPSGIELHRIKMPGITKCTNLEFGGSDGKTLYIVGACDKEVGHGEEDLAGCVNIWRENDSPGCAFQKLVPSVPSWKDEL